MGIASTLRLTAKHHRVAESVIITLKEHQVYDIHSRRKKPLYVLIPGDMMKSSYFGAILICLSSLMSFALIAADSDAGKSKSALCAGCHGIDGIALMVSGQFWRVSMPHI